MKKILLPIFGFLFSTSIASAQLYLFPKKEKPLIRKIYGSVCAWDGIGVYGAVFTRGNNLFTARYLHEDRSITGGNFWQPGKYSHLDETGIMYGKGFEIWRLFLNASAGMAYINYSTDYDPKKITSGGLIGNIQAVYALKPWMAIGFEMYGDLNLYQSRTGVLISLQFGKVRG
jgi:hypothetical protein